MIITSGSDHALVAPAAGLPKLPVVVDTQGRLRAHCCQGLIGGGVEEGSNDAAAEGSTFRRECEITQRI